MTAAIRGEVCVAYVDEPLAAPASTVTVMKAKSDQNHASTTNTEGATVFKIIKFYQLLLQLHVAVDRSSCQLCSRLSHVSVYASCRQQSHTNVVVSREQQVRDIHKVATRNKDIVLIHVNVTVNSKEYCNEKRAKYRVLELKKANVPEGK